MHSLGLDLSDRGTARAVLIDGVGTVVAHAQGADPRDAVHDATASHAAAVAGIASPIEHADVTVGELKVVTRCTPGAAAVAAEQWIRAARGARHPVRLLGGTEGLRRLFLDGNIWSGGPQPAGAA